MDLELELCSEASGGKADKGDKDRGVTGPGAPAVIAKLAVHQLSSMPVDHDTKNNNTLIAGIILLCIYQYAYCIVIQNLYIWWCYCRP